jgi:DNA-binding transcriptional regulator YdaS (Cro superfamily)
VGISLIVKASKICGSDSELARRIGINRVAIAQMKSGQRTISPKTAAELADMAGDDAREAAIETMINNARGTRREGVLKEILGKPLSSGVV